jgi:hypothetical protein
VEGLASVICTLWPDTFAPAQQEWMIANLAVGKADHVPD